MPSVAPVRLTYNPKILWFDPGDVEFSQGDSLIVKTERGLEYGTAEQDTKEVDEEDLEKLKSPLKPVIRKATSEDVCRWQEAQQAARDALPVFKQMVSEKGLDMHPVAVEFLFDGDKAVFYFEAEKRVDFRELVRALAARFHKRIDMRQIGVRDEARIVGGFGHCGQELCCKRLGGEFNPVSIRMAKDQDLSLNPQKISGACGRLMCCLRYEADAYKEFKSRCPKLNATVSIPGGCAKVCDINVPRETVTLMVEDTRVKVPVADMDIDPKTGRPGVVSQEVFEACANRNAPGRAVAENLVTSVFTGSDKLADKPMTRRAVTPESKKSKGQARLADDGRKRQGRKRRSHSGHPSQPSATFQAALDEFAQDHMPQASVKKGQGKSASKRKGGSYSQYSQNKPKQRAQGQGGSKPKRDESRRTRRPGQNSSGLSYSPDSSSRQHSSHSSAHDQQRSQGTEHRRARRRTHRATGETRQDETR